MKYHFIYNPTAGYGISVKVWDKIQMFLAGINFPYTLHMTQYIGHAEQIARKITSVNEMTTIISVGGDGTLSEIINGITDFNKVTIGCIPCGSGNDFVSSTKLQGMTHIDILKYIIKGKSRKINFMYVNGHRVINTMGFGLDTDVLKKYYKMRMFSPKFRYKVATVLKVLTFRWHNCEVQIDDSPWEKLTTMLFSVGNGISIGGGIKMCPNASIDDDYLNLTYVSKFPRIQVFHYLSQTLKGKILELPATRSVKCKSVNIKLATKIYQYDGILVENQNAIKITLAKEKINFLG